LAIRQNPANACSQRERPRAIAAGINGSATPITHPAAATWTGAGLYATSVLENDHGASDTEILAPPANFAVATWPNSWTICIANHMVIALDAMTMTCRPRRPGASGCWTLMFHTPLDTGIVRQGRGWLYPWAMPARKSAFVALLRGINVGGKNVIPMVALRGVFEGAGFTSVGTYIQSGNVVFGGAGTEPSIVKKCEGAVSAWFKKPMRVVVRSGDELERVLADNPYPKADPSRVVVVYCDAEPTGTLDPARSPKDEFAIVGRHLYLHCPEGLGVTKFTPDYIDRTLGVLGTARNLRTSAKLLDMVRSL
jgi:uncharacterized protein (DUF1697 family)